MERILSLTVGDAPPLPAALVCLNRSIPVRVLPPYERDHDDDCDKHNEKNNRAIFHHAPRAENIRRLVRISARGAILLWSYATQTPPLPAALVDRSFA